MDTYICISDKLTLTLIYKVSLVGKDWFLEIDVQWFVLVARREAVKEFGIPAAYARNQCLSFS